MFFFFDLDLGEQLVNSSRVFFFLALVGVIDSSPLLCGGMVARFVCFSFTGLGEYVLEFWREGK